MTLPKHLDIATLRQLYGTGAVTPLDLVEEALARCDSYADKAVWISRVPHDEVRAAARALTRPTPDQQLWGIPFAVKDNIDCAGMETTAACPAFAYRAARDAVTVAKLKAAGAILIGKTNLDQFATGLNGTRSPYGAPRSVFDPAYISGGSSSGSAVAVAAGLVSFALGTDTAGSGRVPAAFNDLVGIKPTRGLLSASGLVPACRSLDCITVLALTVGEGEEVRLIAQGVDTTDPFSRRDRPRALPAARWRFGVLAPEEREFFGDDDRARLYEAAIARMTDLGGQAVTIDYRPFREAAALLYEGPWVAERLAALEEFIATHEADLDPTVATIITGARKFSGADAFRGIYRLEALRHETEGQWEKMDFFLLPTAPTIYTVDAMRADPLRLNARLGLYTNFVNLLDGCAVAVPAGFDSRGLPFGVSLIAPSFHDSALAEIADRFHRASPISLFVVGAHLAGMPLNHELRARGARLQQSCRTAPDYRLFALSSTRPGLLRAPGFKGPGIEGEIWTLTPDAFGSFIARIPAPLGIGRVTIENGSEVMGFLVEAHAVVGLRDITEFGGWRRYLLEQKPHT